MALSFVKDEKRELAVVAGKLDTARKEITSLKSELNRARNAVADSTARNERARADTAEAALADRDRQLKEANASLRQATEDNNRLQKQAERVETVLEKGFESIVKQLVG